MARTRRITLTGRPHLVVARGNNGETLFKSDADFRRYLDVLRDTVKERLVVVYAWCLMKDEVRLVVRPERISLGQFVQRLHGAHARFMNQQHPRSGHLFEDRYTSGIFADELLGEVVRYVHLWPVRVGRVRRVANYEWSSHRAYVAASNAWGDVVDAWSVLGRYGPTLPAAQRAFARFVEQGALDPDTLPIDEPIAGVLGDHAFTEQILAEAGVVWRGRRRPALATLAQRVALLVNVHVTDMQSAARYQDLVMARRLFATSAVRQAGRSVTEVAEFLARDKGQVSRLVQQGMAQARSDAGFRVLFEAMRPRGAEASDGSNAG